MDPGVDVFIVETFYSVEEASLVIPFVKEAGGAGRGHAHLPRQRVYGATVTIRWRRAQRLVDNGADVVGLNCMRPWQTMNDMGAAHSGCGLGACVRPADGVSTGAGRGLQPSHQPRRSLPACPSRV